MAYYPSGRVSAVMGAEQSGQKNFADQQPVFSGIQSAGP